MKLALAGAALLLATQAHADVIIPGSFGGTVDDGTYTDSGPVNTPFTVGQPITGSFTYDATTDTFQTFQIGGYTAAPGYASIHSPALAATPYVYLGVRDTAPGGSITDELQINLYYESPASASTADFTNFILHPGAYSTDLASGAPSYFAAYVTNPNGSVTQVDGLLTSFLAPEPAGWAVALFGLAGLALARRRA